MKRLFFVGIVLACLSGCAATNNDHYHWGHYEVLIHSMYASPEKAAPAVQIQALNQDIVKAHELGKPVPPGVYAHLGLMYGLQGEMKSAKQAFAQEKRLYPESSKLMNRLLHRLETHRKGGR